MTKNIKLYLIIVLLVGAVIYSFVIPKAKYEGPDIFSQLKIPYAIKNWRGMDVEQEWDSEDEKYNFISQAIEREYVNQNGKNLFLCILNAGNFHNPMVCSNSAGFRVDELNNTDFQLSNRTLRTHTLYTQNDSDGYLLLYWICIDKNVVDWTEQKIKQLWFSLFNRKRVGLMIRLDIPSGEDTIEESLRLAKDFMNDLSQSLSADDTNYIFGS